VMWGSDQAPDGTAVAIGTQCADTSTTTCDPIAWKPASDDSDDVVWGSAGVWATSMGSEADNIVWGTNALDRTDNILWGAPAARRRVRLVVAGPPTR